MDTQKTIRTALHYGPIENSLDFAKEQELHHANEIIPILKSLEASKVVELTWFDHP